VERGDLLEISVTPGTAWRPWLESIVTRLRAQGLNAVSASMLLQSGSADR
jgi:hypothetical protein